MDKDKILKILELFAGKQCFSKMAQKLACQTFTSDIEDIKGINYVCDILNFNTEKVPFIPDAIWASPDCAAWSKAAGKFHFDSGSLIPKTEKAEKAFKIIDKTLDIISYFKKINPDLKYYIENPEGKLRFYLQPGTFFSKIPRLVKIDQCQYDREHKKTTHIFTNDHNWISRKRCPGLGNCHHKGNIKNLKSGERSSLGNMGKLRYYERAKIPDALSKEIILHLLKQNL